MQFTRFEDLNALLADFTAGHERILGDNLIGLYLQGSAAVGDMDEYSDVDFIGVLKHDLDGPVLEELRQFHRETFDRTPEVQWAEHLEGSYFPLDVLKDNAATDYKLHYLDNGAREMTRDTHCNTLVVRWCLWEHAIPLSGPDFKTLIDPIPTNQLRAEIHKVMVDWEGWIHDDLEPYLNRFYQSFIVISYCRMLQTIDTGRVHSKPAGAAWGLANTDPKWHDLITKTQTQRDDPAVNVYTAVDRTEMQQTLEFVTYANQLAETMMSQEQTNV